MTLGDVVRVMKVARRPERGINNEALADFATRVKKRLRDQRTVRLVCGREVVIKRLEIP